ncbi:MAG: helix-turn-helix transcriptional regulator [Deltaproteobacteria bacterium]|nr:helix-turn-helix transcriptional regulator [Deltaproteobacteria bacterium]
MLDDEKKIPYGRIENPEELGRLIRSRRKEARARQAKLAGLAGVGVRFLSELERGKPTAELGKTLKVLERLGLEVWILPRGFRLEGDER